MFTGIITHTGVLTHVIPLAGGRDERWRIASPHAPDRFALGASVACAGMCLTVVAVEPDADGGGSIFDADVSSESLRLGVRRAMGDRLNLEHAMTPRDELGGHIVSGHVDDTVRVASVTPDGLSQVWRFVVEDPALMKFVARKGSVTLDGIALTVNMIDGDAFEVMIVPHTRRSTTLAQTPVGAQLNFEIDMLARYAERILIYSASAT